MSGVQLILITGYDGARCVWTAAMTPCGWVVHSQQQMISHSSGGLRSRIKVLAHVAADEDPLSGLSPLLFKRVKQKQEEG